MPRFLPSPETANAFNYAANADTSGITYVGLYLNGLHKAAGLTRDDLSNKLVEHLGLQEFGGRVTSALNTFAKHNLASTTKGLGANGQPVQFFRTISSTATLAAIGVTQRVAEEFNQPTAYLLGGHVGSLTSAGPVTSMHILAGLLDGEKSFSQFVPAVNKRNPKSRNNKRLANMVAAGIVEIRDDSEDFTITDPIYRGPKAFEKLHPLAQTTYRLLGLAKDLDPTAKYTVDSLAALAIENGLITDQQTFKLKLAIKRAASSKAPDAYAGAIVKRNFSPRMYRLADEVTDMAKRLVEGAIAIDDAPAAAGRAVGYALDTYTHRTAAVRIAQRGIDYSKHRPKAA